MKNLLFVLLALSSMSYATSLPSPVLKVAVTLHSLQITKVATEGSVLRERTSHPYTDLLVSIPVMVSTGDACTHFAGQTTVVNEKVVDVTAIGSRNPLTEACIAVMPMPVSQNLTVNVKVLTGGIVAAERIQKRIVQFHGVGLHEISLDLTHNTVTIRPVGPRPQ